MLVVTVKIERSDPNDTGGATISVEKEGKAPQTTEVDPGGSENERKILLDSDEKLVVTGQSETELVWDKDQNAAVPMPRDPVKREEAKLEKQRIRDENLAAQNAAFEEAKKEAEERAAKTRRTNIGNLVPEAEVVAARDTTMKEAARVPPMPPGASKK